MGALNSAFQRFSLSAFYLSRNMETVPSRPTQPPGYPWRIFWVLLTASVMGVAAVLPYVFTLFRTLISTGPLPMPLPVLVAVQLMESAILFAGLIALGLLLARKAGIETPILRRWLYAEPTPLSDGAIGPPLLFGVFVGAFILLVFYTIFLSRIPEWPVAAEAMVPIWKRFLACFYGAINEEILARLFFLSLLLWLLRKIGRETSPRSGPVAFWIANLIVAVLFAAGHIPSAKLIMPITPLVLVALLVMNGTASMVFGFLCWKRGLEAAILAHFSADFVLHVIGPLLLRV
jgi:membrane protease YdiL (CAAX protease family)